MKSLILLFALVFLPTMLFANDILFNRLTKLYSKNPDKCLEASKRFMNYFPDEASSYFYASKVYFDKSKKARTSRTEYSLLKKAISYAAKFEKKDTENLSEKVDWKTVKSEMKQNVMSLSERLSNEEQQSLSSNLVVSFSKLENQNQEFDEITVAENFREKEETSTIVNVNSGLLFGLPNGNENVKSSNPVGEQKLLELINKERTKKGMNPLIWDESLARAARYHAYDLASQDYFDHNSYDRENGKLVKVGGTFTRIGRFYKGSSANSENIAAGSETAEGTYDQWFTSKGHYDNMFNKQSEKVGIGVGYNENSPLKFYWVFCTAL